MPLPVITNVARVALLGHDTVLGLNTVNVIHVERASDGIAWEDAATAMADELELSGNIELWGCNASSWSLREVHYTPLDGTSATLVRLRGARAWPTGNTGGDALPQVCGLVKLVSAVRGRRGRGRIYLGPIGESGQAAGVINPTVQADVTAAWDNFSNALIARGSSQAIGVASYRGRVWNQAVNIACESMTATQRRRQHR